MENIVLKLVSLLKNLAKKMNTIIINNKSFSVSGNCITIKNNTLKVDGKTIEEGLTGNVKVEFTGDLADLNCNSCEIHGNVKGDVNTNSITCRDVVGDVDANIVHCSRITGDVDANNVIISG